MSARPDPVRPISAGHHRPDPTRPSSAAGREGLPGSPEHEGAGGEELLFGRDRRPQSARAGMSGPHHHKGHIGDTAATLRQLEANWKPTEGGRSFQYYVDQRHKGERPKSATQVQEQMPAQHFRLDSPYSQYSAAVEAHAAKREEKEREKKQRGLKDDE